MHSLQIVVPVALVELAELYQVPAKALNLAIKRKTQRFPKDFMFRLTKTEADSSRFQTETSNPGRGGRRYLPYVFTEHGVAMLSSVLTSERAVQVNIAIIRTFIKLREILSTHKDLAERLANLERKYQDTTPDIMWGRQSWRRAGFQAGLSLLNCPLPTHHGDICSKLIECAGNS